MPRFAANLTMLFNEAVPRPLRAPRAPASRAVEFLFPYAYPADARRAARRARPAAGAAQPAGRRLGRGRARHRLPAGPRGRVPQRRGKAIEYARRWAAAGQLPGRHRAGERGPALVAPTLVDNLRFAAPELKAAGIRLLIEPINTFDIPASTSTGRPGARDPRRGRLGQPSCSTTSTTCSSWRASWPRRSEAQCRASRTSSSPTIPGATSRGPARSTTPSCSRTRPHRLRRLDRLRVQAAGTTEAGLGWSRRALPASLRLNIGARMTPMDNSASSASASWARPWPPSARGRPPALRPHPQRRARAIADSARHVALSDAASPSAPTSSSPWCPTRRTWTRCCSARTAWPRASPRARSWST